MRTWPLRLLALVLALVVPGPGQQPVTKSEVLTYGAEWRFVRAGEARLTLQGASQTQLQLRTAGLVAQLYTVDDSYLANYGPGHCAADSIMDAREGRRHRETRITFDSARRRASYFEKDLLKDATVLAKEIETPACVHDLVGALQRLRLQPLQPGQSTSFPLSDGKKFANARVECQEKEVVKTPLGSFPSVRYEAFVFDGALFGRKGRAFFWLTDDDRRIPVQFRIQLPFYVGTVTLQLEKQDRS